MEILKRLRGDVAVLLLAIVLTGYVLVAGGIAVYSVSAVLHPVTGAEAK